MPQQCNVCERSIDRNEDRINCDICKCLVHGNCSGLSKQEITCLMNPNRKLNFFCNKCNITNIVGTMQAEITALKSGVTELKTTISNLNGKTVNNVISGHDGLYV